MGIAPRTQPLGPKSTQADDQFFPIPLSAAPFFGGGQLSGVIFNGYSLEAVIDKSLSCCGKYSIGNTQHYGIAGITQDACILFAVNCRIEGRHFTAMGAFDPTGKPVAPTVDQQNLLGKYMPNPGKAIVLDAKSKSALGLKANGENASMGVYVDASKKHIIFDFKAKSSDPAIAANASIETDRFFKVTNSSVDMSVTRGIATLAGGAKFNEKFKTTSKSLTAGLADGKWGVTGNWERAGDETTRRLDVNYQASKRVKITASWLPDTKPSAPPKISFPFTPAPFVDDSQFRIELKIDLW